MGRLKAKMTMGSNGERVVLCGRMIVGGHALLMLLLVCCPCSASAQLQRSFALKGLNTSTMNCTGASSMTPLLEGLKRAACLTPFPCNNGSGPLTTLAGQCSYMYPIQMTPLRSFSTMFSFNTLKFPTYNTGQGFTFFMSPVSHQVRQYDTGGYLGWINSSMNGDPSGHNFAIEFDIVTNTTAGFNDPPYNHVGVNVNSLNSTYVADIDSDQLTTLSSTATLYVWVEYDGLKRWIDVRVSGKPNKPCNTRISGALDLDLVLLDTMYLGFSSSTGGIGLDNKTQYNTQTSVWDWSFETVGKATNIYDSNQQCGLSLSRTAILAIVIGVLSLVVVTMLGIILFLHVRSRKVSGLEKEKAELVAELKQLDFGARQFSYNEILEATRGFAEPIGVGGFGTVYKGNLANLTSHKAGARGGDTLLAVKRINKTADSEDAKQLVAEVKVIGRLRHVNIVPVLGWCYERSQMLLVYKYMENGDLDQQIFPYDYGFKGEGTISWAKRMGILRGVASALKFLHDDFESDETVLHRDIKTKNVLIDRNFNARLGDFGLARFCDRSSHGHQSQQLIGTQGYMAPEYLTMGASVETDVYSFGVLALVVATGRKPVDRSILVHGSLLRWVREVYNAGKMTEAGDSRLVNKDPTFDQQELERVLTVGLRCCLYEPRERPLMREVVAALQGSSAIFSFPMPDESFKSFPLKYPGINDDDDDDTTQPFEDYKKDEYYTAEQSLFKKVDIA